MPGKNTRVEFVVPKGNGNLFCILAWRNPLGGEELRGMTDVCGVASGT